MKIYIVKSVDKVKNWQRINGAWHYREEHSANIAAYTDRESAEWGCKYLSRLEARTKLGYMYDDECIDKYHLITTYTVEEINVIK